MQIKQEKGHYTLYKESEAIGTAVVDGAAILRLEIVPAWRGRGYGSYLVKELLRRGGGLDDLLERLQRREPHERDVPHDAARLRGGRDGHLRNGGDARAPDRLPHPPARDARLGRELEPVRARRARAASPAPEARLHGAARCGRARSCFFHADASAFVTPPAVGQGACRVCAWIPCRCRPAVPLRGMGA